MHPVGSRPTLCYSLYIMGCVARFALFVLGVASLAATPVEGVCTQTYFPDGQGASSRCTDETGSTETVRVYNRRGEIIGEWGLMLRPSMSSIDIAYHPNGMVRRVRYGQQPDGGIQWYRSTTVYDAEGVIIDFQEESHDMFTRVQAVDSSR